MVRPGGYAVRPGAPMAGAQREAGIASLRMPVGGVITAPAIPRPAR